MLSLIEMPNTEQGLRDYVRYAKRELKTFQRKEKNLNEAIQYCNEQLTIKGFLPERES